MADKYYNSIYYGKEIDDAIGVIISGDIPAMIVEARAARDRAIKEAQNAKTSADSSQSYAVGGTGTRPGEDTDNAKYYAKQAEGAVTGVASFNNRTGAVKPQNGDYRAEMLGSGSHTPGTVNQIALSDGNGGFNFQTKQLSNLYSVNGKTGNPVLYTAGEDDIGVGAPLEDGKLYFVYEP